MHKQVSQWKHRMAQGGRAATAWLKQQTTVAPHTLLACAASPQAHDSVDACFASLRTFWDTIWQRSEVPEELDRLRSVGRLTRRPGLPMPGDWRISPREFRSALQRKVHGAPGCDGWRCEELLPLPLQVWQCFLSLWEAWCAQDSFPTAWQHARQTFLPKVEVVDGCTSVDKMRPICIQPIVCRVLSSCMALKAQQWLLTKVSTDTYGALAGRSVAAAVLLLDSLLQDDGALMSLHIFKYFDMMSPELCLGLLKHEGLHETWIRHLSHMWRDQHRWLGLGPAGGGACSQLSAARLCYGAAGTGGFAYRGYSSSAPVDSRRILRPSSFRR